MIDRTNQPRVPARLVLLSLAALWACYFLVATLRGAVMGLDFDWPIISRRLTICIVSMLVMAAAWPLLQLLDRRSFGTRVAAVLAGALPVSLLLGYINDTIFADINARHMMEKSEKTGGIRIMEDDAGNILVDLPPTPPVPPAPPRPPEPSGVGERAGAPATPPAPEPTRTSPPRGWGGKVEADDAQKARWAGIADTAFGRYFLVLAWAALYFALVKAEEARAAERREGEYRRAAAAAELRSLRYQVNPHFLFNTLNSLSALVMTGRQGSAETMIQNLSTFYRRTLSGDPTSDLPLADEIELQKLYFAIEAVRFPDRLLTRFDIDEGVAHAMVPGMILQPLVENSVKYAVAATTRPVTIAIEARRQGDELAVSVSDDGPGAESLRSHGCGIGLANVRDRLRARYGETAAIEFGPRPEGGFRTVLRLPLELGRA